MIKFKTIREKTSALDGMMNMMSGKNNNNDNNENKVDRLDEFQKRMKRLEGLLHSPNETEFVVVTIPTEVVCLYMALIDIETNMTTCIPIV